MESNGLATIAALLAFLAIYLIGSGVFAALFGKFGISPGKAFIPFYNIFLYLRETMQSTVLAVIGLLVPIANMVIGVISLWKLREGFGAGIGMFLLSLLMPPIGMLVYAFGSRAWRVNAPLPSASIVRN